MYHERGTNYAQGDMLVVCFTSVTLRADQSAIFPKTWKSLPSPSLPGVPYRGTSLIRNRPPPLGPAEEPRHGPTVGSYGVAVSYERGTLVGPIRSTVGT